MTDVKNKRSMFENQQNCTASPEIRRRPPPLPKSRSLAVPTHPNHSAPVSASVETSQGEAAGEKVHRLNPALIKSLDKPLSKGRLSPAGKGGVAAGKAKSLSPSPALNKKAKSASKIVAANGTAIQPNRLGVGLLASVTSVSTGNLHAQSSSSSSVSNSSSSFSSSKRRPSPPSVLAKASSASPPQQQKSRKTAALSMDVSRINTASSVAHHSKPARPVSTTGSSQRVSPGGRGPLHQQNTPLSTASRRLATESFLSRSREDSFDSLEDSYSPPGSRQSSTKAVSRSANNLLDEPTPSHQSVRKPRSNSDNLSSPRVTLPPSVAKKRSKPALPPKRPGLMNKPAPPPKPHIAQLKKSPEFSRHVVSPEVTTPTSTSSPANNRLRSTSTNSDLASPLLPGDSPVSPSMMSSPPLRERGGEPSTPSPRTSQLEAVKRNADSGFASETAEDLISPVTEKRKAEEEFIIERGVSEEGFSSPSVIERSKGEGGEGGEEAQGQRGEGEEGRGVEEGEGESAAPATITEVWDEPRLEKARSKRLHIAEELLKTEATYVERLQVIAVKFHGAVRDFNTHSKHVIPDSDINRIFLNISQIYNLNTNILEELQKRMDTWSTEEGLGDVIERLAPFLKLYAHYAAGFEDAMKIFTSWTKREKKFDALVRDFERQLATGLGVAHYMLEPVQRIPRYRLLLTDYLKYTPPDSPDRQPTEKALGIISEAADHSNDRIKELENSNTILSIQRSLQDYEGTLLAPGRLFLHCGQLQKFSRKTTTPRMFFLFSDMLLHTEPAGNDVYKFKNEMPLFMMKVEEPVVSLVAHSFNVESTTRSLILVASSEAEKNDWMMYLRRAINEECKKRSSLRREMSTRVVQGVFGAQAPIMVPDKSVTMCQACTAVFTFTFRRHHCRVCGKVVCGGCSQWKVYIPYLKKMERVCERCNYTAKSESGEEVAPAPPSPKTSKKKEGILDLKGYEEDTIKGGYVLSQDGRRWNRLWYQLKQDFCLYKFRAHEDIKAMSSLPLPGYIVRSDRNTHTINLVHPSSNKKELSDTFRLENPEDFDIWVIALESVVQLQVPSLPSESKVISPPPVPAEKRVRSQSLRDLHSLSDDHSFDKSL